MREIKEKAAIVLVISVPAGGTITLILFLLSFFFSIGWPMILIPTLVPLAVVGVASILFLVSILRRF